MAVEGGTRMANHGLIVGLDVGTNTVKVLAADVRDQQVNVIAVGRSVSHGVKRGVVVDIEATSQDIRQAMAQVNEQSNQAVTEVVASIPANNIQIQNVTGLVTVQDSQHISYVDVVAAVKEAISVNIPVDREIVDLVPNSFSVDDFDGIQDPNDMVGMRLAIKATAYTASKHVMGNLRKAIERAGLSIRDMVLAPLASSKTILSEAEQEFGAILLDMGAGQTNATVVRDNQVRFITVFPAGGEHISRDISTVLNIGVHDADILKLDNGVAVPRLADRDQHVVIQEVGEEQPKEISEEYLAQIIAARVQQIVGSIGEKLQTVSALGLPGGVIVIGGTAAMQGLTDVVQDTYDTPAKMFIPQDIGLRHPGFSGVWALIHYAALQTPVQLVVKEALYDLPVTALTTMSEVKPTSFMSKKVKPQQTQYAVSDEIVQEPQRFEYEENKSSGFFQNFKQKIKQFFETFFD